MRKIVAIGSANPSQYASQTFVNAIKQLSTKSNPKVLYIPTASSDREDLLPWLKETFLSEEKGADIDVLYLLSENVNFVSISEKIRKADIIFAGDGNALMMMRKWRFLKLNSLLKSALDRGAVLAGINTGAQCWFSYGHSDSMAYYFEQENQSKEWNFIRIKGLGFIDRIIFCTQYQKPEMQASFKNMVKKMGNIGIAITDNSALIVKDREFKFLPENENSKLYKVYKTRKEVIEINMDSYEEWTDFSELLRKG